MAKKILIAGAGGYIGSLMTEFFLERNYEVIALDRFFFGDNLNDLKTTKKIKIIKDDIRYCSEEIFQGINTVINLASISNDPASSLNPVFTQEINHKGAVRIASLAKAKGVKKYIFASSCSTYGASSGIVDETSALTPLSKYAKSKIAAEKDLFKLADPNFCVTLTRNATVYGLSKRRMRFDLIVNLMTLSSWKNKKIFIMGGGKQWRPLIHLKDLITAFYLIEKENNFKKINKQIFNVGCDKQNYQVYQTAQIFKTYFPDLTIEEIPDDPDQRSYRVSFAKIKKTLGFLPQKTIQDGILEIKDGLEKGIITDEIKTITAKYYQYLMEADKILSSLKINNNLF